MPPHQHNAHAAGEQGRSLNLVRAFVPSAMATSIWSRLPGRF
nr:MAG TPA: hypothetical protein [Caudoviricetes sp.]